MKKGSLATVLVLSTVGMVLFAQAETNKDGGFQDPAQPKVEQQGKKDMKRMEPRGERPQAPKERERGEPRKAPPAGGFMPSREPSKVAEADKWQDDQPVLLEGNIVKQVGKKDFVFKDDSGELTLEIDRRAWHGGMVTPNDKVKIIADVEKSWGKTEVEAHFVEKVKADKAPKTE